MNRKQIQKIEEINRKISLIQDRLHLLVSAQNSLLESEVKLKKVNETLDKVKDECKSCRTLFLFLMFTQIVFFVTL